MFNQFYFVTLYNHWAHEAQSHTNPCTNNSHKSPEPFKNVYLGQSSRRQYKLGNTWDSEYPEHILVQYHETSMILRPERGVAVVVVVVVGKKK